MSFQLFERLILAFDHGVDLHYNDLGFVELEIRFIAQILKLFGRIAPFGDHVAGIKLELIRIPILLYVLFLD